jgi:hypothetical protein
MLCVLTEISLDLSVFSVNLLHRRACACAHTHMHTCMYMFMYVCLHMYTSNMSVINPTHLLQDQTIKLSFHTNKMTTLKIARIIFFFKIVSTVHHDYILNYNCQLDNLIYSLLCASLTHVGVLHMPPSRTVFCLQINILISHDSMCLSVSKKHAVHDDGVRNTLKCIRLGIDK